MRLMLLVLPLFSVFGQENMQRNPNFGSNIVIGYATLPATCNQRQIAVLTTDGSLNICTATNTWTKVKAGALVAADIPTTPATANTTISLSAPRGYAICTNTCTVTLPVPALGYEFCIRNANNSATVITLAARANVFYELTTRAAYGTAGNKFVSGGAITDQICVVGLDSTHYLTMSSTGTWTDTAP